MMAIGMLVIAVFAAGGLAGTFFDQAFRCMAVGIRKHRNKEKIQEKQYMFCFVFQERARSHKFSTQISYIVKLSDTFTTVSGKIL